MAKRVITERSATEEPRVQPESLDSILTELDNCRLCARGASGKTLVFGEGDPQAELMFVSDGLGEQENNEGQLLDKMIEAMGLTRAQVFITNVAKCRAQGIPEPDEIATCSHFLHRQIRSIQPKIIVALGELAAQTLLQTDTKISELRGKFHSFNEIRLMPTFHPADLLRNPASKRDTWADLKQVAATLGLALPTRG
jgi:uracil-DNA glycosylase